MPANGEIPGVDEVRKKWISFVLVSVDFMGKFLTLWAEQTL
jgi:hypothetical protein